MTENLSSERTVDDWSVATLDLDAYLTRIGYAGPLEPTEATLAGLYKAHLASVRFENLDVFLRGGVAVDLPSIQDKIVFRGRGGYCYEQAQLFGAVLERLGFTVQRRLARVGPDGGPARGRTHLTLRVPLNAGVWLVDPGFGNSPPAPLSMRRYRSGGPQELDGWIYEVTPDEENGDEVWKLREYQAGEWVTLHRWDEAPTHPVDVVLSNYFTSTHPDSWFTWQPIIVRRDPDAVRSIVGRSHTIIRPGHVKERRTLTDAEFAAALTTEFALTLTPDEIATLTAAPVAPSTPR
ncbi:MAG TPA: arylamine N-acetyltransferase [Trebonia sp.]|jgi:N-hydroxyarylamine O-acetyltransferase|nr:arylamine N-acetyltransferase [Trebonia sp.]